MREKMFLPFFSPSRASDGKYIHLNLREEGPSHYAWCYFIVSSVSTSSRVGLFLHIERKKTDGQLSKKLTAPTLAIHLLKINRASVQFPQRQILNKIAKTTEMRSQRNRIIIYNQSLTMLLRPTSNNNSRGKHFDLRLTKTSCIAVETLRSVYLPLTS